MEAHLKKPGDTILPGGQKEEGLVALKYWVQCFDRESLAGVEGSMLSYQRFLETSAS
jgi:hypothetical protein